MSTSAAIPDATCRYIGASVQTADKRGKRLRNGSLGHAAGAYLLAILLLAVAGCGGGGGAPAAGTDQPVSHAVIGKVTLNGAGLGQVSLAVTGAATEIDDGNGNYSVNSLANGSYTITPSRYGYSFTPASRTVAINDDGAVANFSAALIPSYSVTVKVASKNNQGLAGVTVSVTDGVTGASIGTRVTDGSGSFSLSGLTNGSYVITPTDSLGYGLNPANQSVTVANGDVSANFAAPVNTYTVSGKVAQNGAGLAKVALVLSTAANSSLSFSTASAGDGSYSFAGLPAGYYALSPALQGYEFVPDPYLVHIIDPIDELTTGDKVLDDINAASSASGGGVLNATI